MFLFKGEGIVTPCFPQIVNITELAKDYGKTHKYEYVCKWTCRKRSMNVNDSLNLLQNC
jgi:hypothetical protein